MKKTRYEWDKKRLIKVLIAIVIFLIAMQGYAHLGLYRDLELDDTSRYLHQLCGLIMGATAIFAVLTFRKAIPQKLKKDVAQAVASVFKRISQEAAKVAKAIRHALGIPDPPVRVKGRDERSFVFDMEDNNLSRRFRQMGNQLRWKDLEDNADKIRFIYIKFINKLIKKGYKFKTINTPLETLKQWNLEHEQCAYMFPLYTCARYSGGRRPITDEEVEQSEKYMKINAKVV